MGAAGRWESAIAIQIKRERDWGLIDFRAPTRDSVALMGLPDISGETTRWKVPDEFPQVKRDGAEGILFLDELNAAPPSMMAAMFGLVLDRKVSDFKLPPGWRAVAAGNRQAERATAQRMTSALANRFAHIGVDAQLVAFLALPAGAHPHDAEERRMGVPDLTRVGAAARYLDKPTSRQLSFVSKCTRIVFR